MAVKPPTHQNDVDGCMTLQRQCDAGAPGSAAYDAIMHPTEHRLLAQCGGVLRLAGASAGADKDVAVARARGLPVWTRVEDIPEATTEPTFPA